MAAALLVLFPLLLMFNAPAAFVSLAIAIVLLYRRNASGERRNVRRTYVSEDSSI
jgi:hypothetical protein